MECFLMTLLLLSLSLSILFVSGENDNLSNDYDLTEESITVYLKAYKEEVLQCNIQIETSEPGFYDFYPLYDKARLIHRFSMFHYIGNTDNSCSFIVYPKKYVFEDYFNLYDAFKRKWTIIEKYSCDKSFWNIVTFVYDWERQGCYREYNIFFNPRDMIEVMSMTWAATKIIRKAPYDNKTLTVFLQSEKQPISLCKLNIGLYWFKFFDLRNNDIIIYNKYTSYSSSAESGIEYIGFNDNSCSVRIHLDVLNATNKENDILNQDWIITVGGRNKNSIYSFYMGSKNWWIHHHYSKVFLRKKFPSSTDVQHY